ncbi:MAG TPA: AAA family ATPase [Allosphingosinicella sp.]|jgi:exopolysaccharide/PEP-CTERM locus tyrosine autokinase
MNQHSPLRSSGSLIERAAELYGFGLTAPAAAPLPVLEAAPEPRTPPVELEIARPAPARPAGIAVVDRQKLADAGFIVPDAPAGVLAEEFRIVKRQLLLGTGPGSSVQADKRRTILVCSALPDEGKTFCAVNLALSLAGEREMEVLLVDADFPKPEVLSILGIEGKAGLVDALADPSIDPESLVIRTDAGSLCVLPSGRQENDIPELLASERTREVLARLVEAKPNRIVIFDSPPALMASAACVLASHVGQLLMVVRADTTTEADLKEAVGLLSGCGQTSLLLNGAGFAATGRRFGSYYGYSQ